jgi:hypothetical protein
MNATLVRELFLTAVQMRCVDILCEDEMMHPENLKVLSQSILEPAMAALRFSFKYPAKVLQQDREIARYPLTLWSHLLHSVGLGKYATYKRVLLNEHLAFTGIKIPPEMKIGMTVCYDYREIIGSAPTL